MSDVTVEQLADTVGTPVDRLLKQISNAGIHSLSRRDREFLKRVSSRGR